MFFKKDKVKANDDKIQVDTRTITTMVGSDTVFEGVINTKASIRINGTVRGKVEADGIVILTKSGHIEGTIEAESIIVAGRIDGNMSIRDKVNVEPTGQIYGEIITKKFVIDEESVFEGNVVMNRDGKVIPVTPYKPESQVKQEEELENTLREKIKKELEDEAKKKDEKEKDKDKDDKSESDKDKDEDKDKKDDSKESDSKDNPDDKEDKPDDEKSDDDKADRSDDSDKEDNHEEEKDAEIIIADINEIEDGDDIPETEAKDSKKSNIKKSKSLNVEVEDE